MSTKKEHTVKKILTAKLIELQAAQNVRLDEIEKFVKGELAKINDRNKAINGHVVGESLGMGNKIYNMELTNDAIKEILNESGLVGNLDDKIAVKRAALHEAREKAAQEKMTADMQPKAEEQPQADAPVESAPEQPVAQG